MVWIIFWIANKIDNGNESRNIDFLFLADFFDCLFSESKGKPKAIDNRKNMMVATYDIFHTVRFFVFLFHFDEVDNFAIAKE